MEELETVNGEEWHPLKPPVRHRLEITHRRTHFLKSKFQ